jgi:hypothetical protein
MFLAPFTHFLSRHVFLSPILVTHFLSFFSGSLFPFCFLDVIEHQLTSHIEVIFFGFLDPKHDEKFGVDVAQPIDQGFS